MQIDLSKVIERADRDHNGHFTLFKFTTGYKVVYGTPAMDEDQREYLKHMVRNKMTLQEAVEYAENHVTSDNGMGDYNCYSRDSLNIDDYSDTVQTTARLIDETKHQLFHGVAYLSDIADSLKIMSGEEDTTYRVRELEKRLEILAEKIVTIENIESEEVRRDRFYDLLDESQKTAQEQIRRERLEKQEIENLYQQAALLGLKINIVADE